MARLKFEDSGLTRGEWRTLSRLNTPAEIQDYLNSLTFNSKKGGRTHMSVRQVLKTKRAHCIEGALVAAAALWIKGELPLLLDLVSAPPDFDHVVALYKTRGKWGAISKTNHAVLRYREPVYQSVRELAMSYFHEYFLANGKKTMRTYSAPFDLSKLDTSWLTSEKNLFALAEKLDKSRHTQVVTPREAGNLRLADPIERKAGKIVEYKYAK